MDTKTAKAKEYLRQGMFEKALSIICRFRLGFTKEEKRILLIAHESLSGHSSFYKSIGIDTNLYISKAREIVNNKYND